MGYFTTVNADIMLRTTEKLSGMKPHSYEKIFKQKPEGTKHLWTSKPCRCYF